jgi:hypothetical protein
MLEFHLVGLAWFGVMMVTALVINSLIDLAIDRVAEYRERRAPGGSADR